IADQPGDRVEGPRQTARQLRQLPLTVRAGIDVGIHRPRLFRFQFLPEELQQDVRGRVVHGHRRGPQSHARGCRPRWSEYSLASKLLIRYFAWYTEPMLIPRRPAPSPAGSPSTASNQKACQVASPTRAWTRSTAALRSGAS